jgi:hypothetical protein
VPLVPEDHAATTTAPQVVSAFRMMNAMCSTEFTQIVGPFRHSATATVGTATWEGRIAGSSISAFRGDSVGPIVKCYVAESNRFVNGTYSDDGSWPRAGGARSHAPR